MKPAACADTGCTKIGGKDTCTAYPNGIPDEIAYGGKACTFSSQRVILHRSLMNSANRKPQ